ncbi:hypothetical protein GLW07_07705 [Bacillus hwajinpoensis]|uniref:Uncharacterized protein n=1 Tax=Guptibacillus hwajinpoensis TaxID=208199 RepID=A0A845EXH9_9BACL|nr:hypothetical protein [Pseudalkalibacillus hwajinpoensis]MYL63239.1 hypothetical protein [Pseudalkalibacillus hwajinpoensis]
MKRLVIANFLLIISLIYLIYRITKPKLYLPAFSIEAENPVKLTLTTLTIDTGFITGNAGSIYSIWLSPIYLLILIACVLTISPLISKKR